MSRVDFAGRHALDAESRSTRWHLDIFDVDKISLHPTVAAILDRARPVGMGRGEFLVRKTLCAIIGEASLRGETLFVDEILRALVKVGARKWADDDSAVAAAHSGAERPIREAGNAHGGAAISDGAARDMLGARKTP